MTTTDEAISVIKQALNDLAKKGVRIESIDVDYTDTSTSNGPQYVLTSIQYTASTPGN